MPFCVRIFLKFLYDELTKEKGKYSQEQIYGIIADFLVQKWLLRVCFEELNQYGLTKNFLLGDNCKANLKLLSKVMLAIFKMDYGDLSNADDVFRSFY